MPKKGYKQTEEHRLKKSIAVTGTNNPFYGKSHSEEVKSKLSKIAEGRPSPFRGKKHTQEVKDFLSTKQKGNRNSPKGSDAPWWKGDKVGYWGLHMWVRKELGRPDTCTTCLKSGLKGIQIHWANISGEYKRELSDWVRLCSQCHKDVDYPKGGNIIRNKYGK